MLFETYHNIQRTAFENCKKGSSPGSGSCQEELVPLNRASSSNKLYFALRLRERWDSSRPKFLTKCFIVLLSFFGGVFLITSYFFLLKRNRFGEIPLSQNSRNTDPLFSQKSKFFFFFFFYYQKMLSRDFRSFSFYMWMDTAAMWPAGGETMRQVDPNLLDASSSVAQDRRNLSKSIPIFYFFHILRGVAMHSDTFSRKKVGFRMKIATMIINLYVNILFDDSSSGMRWMWNSTFTLPSINGPGGIGAKLFSLFFDGPDLSKL